MKKEKIRTMENSLKNLTQKAENDIIDDSDLDECDELLSSESSSDENMDPNPIVAAAIIHHSIDAETSSRIQNANNQRVSSTNGEVHGRNEFELSVSLTTTFEGGIGCQSIANKFADTTASDENDRRTLKKLQSKESKFSLRIHLIISV